MRVQNRGKYLKRGGLIIALFFIIKTYLDLQPIDQLYLAVIQDQQNMRVTDRQGRLLTVSYQSAWNYHDYYSLHQFPQFLVKALIFSEDQRFYKHSGVDWRAKTAALWQNIKSRRFVRGASTISGQVVHMLTKRPRTLWSKYLEAIEAHLLECQFSKNHILEFYLNQVPFAANRHGMVQAAHFYFNRDLSTLTPKEMLALIILIKAPSAYDLRKSTNPVDKKLVQLIRGLSYQKLLDPQEAQKLEGQPLLLESPSSSVNVYHFVNYLRKAYPEKLIKFQSKVIRTTLDRSLQEYAQKLLDQRLKFLKTRRVNNGAIVIANHQTGEVLAWVVGGASLSSNQAPGSMINAVVALRQPGSALKPFVYALALEKGWQTTTLIEDAPLKGAVRNGLHKFRNYSNTYYGMVTVREALGNSLNVPAVKTLQFVGGDTFLNLLRKTGFGSLQLGADIYDEGLALGNGEVTLLELVQGYMVLANQGKKQDLHFFLDDKQSRQTLQAIPEEISSIIGDILSDPWARRLEFGSSSVLNLPIQTAIKTGTSTDYRDAWILGYDHRHVVGIWLGNLDNTPMNGITGAIGPALTLRSLFAYLNRNQPPQGLYLSPKVTLKDVCLQKEAGKECSWQTELFHQQLPNLDKSERGSQRVGLITPTPGLKMAIDPRVPLEKQKFEFRITSLSEGEQVEWWVNGQAITVSKNPTYLWPLQKGHHLVKAIIYKNGKSLGQTSEVGFTVK